MINELSEKRVSFDLYKSSVCHKVKENGDIKFILDTLKRYNKFDNVQTKH